MPTRTDALPALPAVRPSSAKEPVVEPNPWRAIRFELRCLAEDRVGRTGRVNTGPLDVA